MASPFLLTLGQKCFPQRYLMSFMAFLGVVVAYILRTNFNLAITMMVKNPGKTSSCSNISSERRDNHVCSRELDWDELTQGWVLSSFYLGYVLAHLPGAYLARKIGGKHTLGIGILGSSICSFISPPAACYSSGAIITTRIAMGFVEGPTFPALSELLSQWAPPSERTLLSATVFAGVQIGSVISMAISGYMLQVMKWDMIFYVFGAVGIIWYVIWILICYDKPSEHPFISSAELNYLIDSIPEEDKTMPTPWKEILKSVPVWFLIIAEIGHDYALFTLITDLPKYYCSVTNLEISLTGLAAAVPYLVMWFASVLLGYISDKIIEVKNTDTIRTKLRRILATIGAIVPGIGMVGATYVTNDSLLFALISISAGFMACCYSSIRVNPLDLSPNHAATIMALANGAGAISGLIAPLAVGAMLTSEKEENWRKVFWVVLAILIVSNMPFAFYGSGNVQPWNEPAEEPVTDEMRRRSTISGGEPIREKYKEYYREQVIVEE